VAEPWLSANEIAAHFGVTKDSVYSWIAEKAMPAHRAERLRKRVTGEIVGWTAAGGGWRPGSSTASPGEVSGRPHDRNDDGHGKGKR
jgi:excisionase family DNA binding protein